MNLTASASLICLYKCQSGCECLSRYTELYKRPYHNKSKLVADGTVNLVKELKEAGKTFEQIAQIVDKSRQQVSQIYYKAIAKGY